MIRKREKMQCNHLKVTIVWLLTLVLVIFQTSLARGQEEKSSTASETASSQKPLLLEEVSITATRIEKELFETPTNVTLLRGDELRRRNPMTLDDALLESGIFVQDTSHVGGGPIIRGLMGNQLLILIDGNRMTNVRSITGPNPDFGKIDPSIVERVEIIHGPGSVLYGTDALGAVINIITKKPKLSSGRGFEFHPKLSFSYGSADRRLRPRLELSGASKRISFLAGGTLQRVHDLRSGRGGLGIQVPSSWEEGAWDIKGELHLSEQQSIELALQDLRQTKLTTFGRPGFTNTLGYADRDLASLEYQIRNISSALSQLKLKAYFHNQDSVQKWTDKFDERFSDLNSYSAEAQASSPIGIKGFSQRLTYGLHFHRDVSKGKQQSKKGITKNPDLTWDNFALFAQDEVEIVGRLSAIFGGRWDWYHTLSTPPEKKLLPELLNPEDLTIDDTGTFMTGSLGLVFHLNQHLNLTSNVGKGFRVPVSNMVGFGPMTFGYIVPSPNLKPELSTSYEAGIRVKYPRFSGSITLYNTSFTDFVDSKPGSFKGLTWVDRNDDGKRDGIEDVYVQTNVGKAWIYGVEGAADFRFTNQWSAFGNFSFDKGRNVTDDEPLDRAMPTLGTVGIRYTSRDGKFWAELTSFMADDFLKEEIPEDRWKRDSAFRVDPRDPKSPFFAQKGVPGYAVFNLRAGRELPYGSLSLGVENIADRKYRPKDSRIDAPGLNFVFDYTLKF